MAVIKNEVKLIEIIKPTTTPSYLEPKGEILLLRFKISPLGSK